MVSEDTVFPPPPQASTVTVDETPSRVQLIAWTFVSAEVYDKLDHQDDPTNVGYMDADILAEYAGRTCYQSWSKPNPETATNAGYLRNVIDHQHFSVLEHASATFLITGVSRSLLAELSRHRHLSLSVESQRYVPQDEGEPVIPPLLRKYPAITDVLICAHKASIGDYEEIITALMARQADGDKLTKKEIREAARSVLLNSQPVSMVVTGNLRAWREVLTKRYHIAADAEIRELAGELLTILRRVAPNSFSDFPNQPFGNDTIRRSA
ncbi:FAD-dependent thymidylate synthase [Herbidospora galbida]|uniref:Flavin-dependent thymidylate synthase n=1 Tax=Herbidospora galbida TaxID=2575442 RepID=A0A4V5UYG3_9ACTN|nr:FAD-dependent thymidylate synthase [Herbidospora galbida]